MVKKENEKWARQAQAVRATQIAIDVSDQVHRFIQIQSVQAHLKPSDFIRKTLGLSYKKTKVRPRLTFSLTETDYQQLAEKFNLPAEDKIAIKHAVSDLLMELSQE